MERNEDYIHRTKVFPHTFVNHKKKKVTLLCRSLGNTPSIKPSKSVL